MKMNASRAKELLVPLKNGKANVMSPAWIERLIEALEYVIENESNRCAECGLEVVGVETLCKVCYEERRTNERPT